MVILYGALGAGLPTLYGVVHRIQMRRDDMDSIDKDKEEEDERMFFTHERLHRQFLEQLKDEPRAESPKSLARTPDHLYKAITGAGFLEADIPDDKEEG